MKEADNVKILEPGDKLYRYGLNSGYPADWDTKNHSIEYYSDEYGHKNQIGALFFYDCESAAVKVLSAAINKQKKIGNIISSATITTTEVVDNIVLLDLEKGISRCTQLVTCLYNLGIDIMTDMFYNFQKKDSYDSIRESFFQLYSEDWKERMMAAKIVDDFFIHYLPFWVSLLLISRMGMLLNNFFKNMVMKDIFLWKNSIATPIAFFRLSI